MFLPSHTAFRAPVDRALNILAAFTCYMKAHVLLFSDIWHAGSI